jgi:hypothetical protein
MKTIQVDRFITSGFRHFVIYTSIAPTHLITLIYCK